MLEGLRSVINQVADLDAAKAWYTALLGQPPYFDEPFYVGFNVGGYELGLDPDLSEAAPGAGGSVAYWGVADLAKTLDRLAADGIDVASPLHDVGEGILVATLRDPFGNVVGLIQNPHFKLST